MTLIKQNNQSKFCSKGGFSAKTIRSDYGRLCDDPLKASLAIGACTGFADFGSSKCHPKAVAAINKAVPGAGGSLDAALSIIANSLNPNNAKRVCDSVGEFLPDLVAKCTFLVGASMPGPIPGAKPAVTATPPTPEKVIPALPKVLNAAWQAVQNENQDQCREMMKVYMNSGESINGVLISLDQLKETEIFLLNPPNDPKEIPYKKKMAYLYGIKHNAFFRKWSMRIAVLIPEKVFSDEFLNYEDIYRDYKVRIDVMAPTVLPTAAKNDIKCVFVATGVKKK